MIIFYDNNLYITAIDVKLHIRQPFIISISQFHNYLQRTGLVTHQSYFSDYLGFQTNNKRMQKVY